MGAGLLDYERRQWLLFVWGLVLVVLGALAMVVVNLNAAPSSPPKETAVESSTYIWGHEASKVLRASTG